MKKSRTEVDHDSYNCEIGTLAIKSDIQAIDPWLKLSYKKQSYFFQGSAYIIYNDTQKRAQFVSETYSIDYFNNSDYQLIAMITKEGHIYYLKDNMKTKMVSFLHNFNQKRISFFKNSEDFIFISCSKDENKKNSFFNKMEESAKKENIPLSDLFNKIENNLFNNNNIFKKILNADIEEENSEEKNNFENNISEEKEKISLSKNSKKSEDLIFENQKIDINFLNKEEIKIKKSSANANYKKNYDSKKNNKNKDESESESEESKSSEKNENIQKYVSLRIFEKFSKEKIFERLNLIKNLKLPKINDCIWNNKNKVFDEIWIPSNSPHKLESIIKTYFYINSEKKNNNKNYSKNQEKRKTRTCTKIIDVDLEKNSQVKSSNKFVSISITNKTNKALNEIRKFENFIGLGEMNNGKNKKAISVAKFSQLPNKIVDLFYNPNDHKRYNDVEFHGSLLSFTFPSTTCGTCSARGHWKENCTFYMQEMVEIHGPHLHCKNIKLKAKPPKKEYWRSKYRGNTPINVVKRQNQSFPTYYCPITKNKKLEKNDLKQFIFSNQKESKQLKNCPDMIDKIEDIFLKHINENKELLLSNKEINEDEIDEAIEFLNEFLDDAIKRGEMSCTFNYKDTIIYARFKKEYGKKEEKKIDLLTKIYFYTIVNNKDPIYNLSLKISEIKKEIEVLKSKEEDNTNEILLLDDTLKKLENEKKYVKENGKPHLIIGIVPPKEKDSKKTI